MNVDDEIEIKIVGKSGNYGLGYRSGFIIFVPEASPGEQLKVRITEVKRYIAYAEYVAEVNLQSKNYESEDEDDLDYPGYEFEGEKGDE